MNIIILGVGKVGETLVKNFVDENHSVSVIDKNSDLVTRIVDKYDVVGKVGSGLERDVLLDVGIANCDFFIAATIGDEINVLSCVLAKKLGAKFTIARVRAPELFKEIKSLKTDLGLDLFFNPEFQTAKEIVQDLKFPSARDVESFADGRATMAGFFVAEGSRLSGLSLIEINKKYAQEVLFATVVRKDEVIIPHGDFVIENGDIIYVVASDSKLFAFCKKLEIYKHRAKTVFIVGGGKVSYYLAKELVDFGVDVKILEKDKERASVLSELLPEVSVLVGDGSNQAVLDEEGLGSSDACVTLTGMDEQNVIISLYAREKAIDKIITKVDKPSVFNMVEQLGLTSVVSPKDVIANHIVRYVRAHKSDITDGINRLYKIAGKIEALEFTVKESFTGVGTVIRDLKLKKNILICGIVRNNEFILPRGDSELQISDRVILVADAHQIAELNEILK